MNNDFIKFLLSGKAESSRAVEETRQTVTSVAGALFPAIAGKLFTREEREMIFQSWYGALKERIEEEAKEIDSAFMSLSDEQKKQTAGFYGFVGAETPDGETIKILGKQKLDKWSNSARALLALEKMR